MEGKKIFARRCVVPFNRSATFSRYAALAASLGLSAFAVAPALGAFIVDQQQLINDNGNGRASGAQSPAFGQSFTPSLSSINWGEFVLREADTGPVVVNLTILDGVSGPSGLSGFVLAGSQTVTVSSTSFSTVHFQLTATQALTPGHPYVLAVNILTPNSAVEWEQANNDYAGGQMLQNGLSPTFLANQDYVFSEGVGVPEPSCGLILFTAGPAWLVARRRTRRA